MSNYLLEIGVEEFPSDYVKSTKESLKNKFDELLTKKKFAFENIKVESTPRRFAVFINNISVKSQSEKQKIKGPSRKIAFDKDNNPTKALMGFLKSKNLTLDNIVIEEFKGEEYIFAVLQQEEISLKKVLQDNVYELVKSLNFPRSMRWAGREIKFARPIRWFVSMLDDEVLPFFSENIQVGNITKGHRVLGKDHIEIKRQNDYVDLLRDNYVILEYKERRNIILRGLNRLANEKGASFMEDEDLLDEVINIVEYPTVIIGEIDNEYLKLPKEVIITPMKDHQRYFPLQDDNGNLLPYFMTVRNGDDNHNENVINGNKRVLTARLEDAKFFYDIDRSHKLEYYVEKLKDLTFYEGLGNMLNKTERLVFLSNAYLEQFGMGEDIKHKLNRASYLSKADLVTKTVIEFTELQGIIGSIYALEDGEDEVVATAIKEQYLPTSQSSDFPQTTVGIVLSVADKMDNICGLYSIEKYVTGTKDPYGLRRQALAVINILIENKIDVNLKDLIKDSLFAYIDKDELSLDYEKSSKEVLKFFKERLKYKFIDDNYRYDLVNSVLSTGIDNIYDMYVRINCLTEISQSEDFQECMNLFTRISNLAKNSEQEEDVDFNALENDEEKEIYHWITDFEQYDKLITLKQYPEAINHIMQKKNLINDYLDHTMIMVDDVRLKNARLNLLKKIDDKISQILHVQEIVIK